MTNDIMRLPANDIFDVAKRALQHAGRGVSFIARRAANTGASELARLDRRALADTGYGRIDWDSGNGEAIQDALIKIYDW